MKYKKKHVIPPGKTIRLKDNHTWNAPKGYKILVIDRGAASFNIPESWLLMKMEPLELHNAEPPNDNARLMVTVMRSPPGIDWTELPLEPLLLKSIVTSEKDVVSTSNPETVTRPDVQLVWVQQRFIDPVERPREAFSRIAIARGGSMHLLFTFDYWVDKADEFIPAWDEVIRSLQMGRYIKDPTKGEPHH